MYIFSLIGSLPPYPEGAHIGTVRRQVTVKQSAEQVYLLAVRAHFKAVFVDAAQAGFFVQELTGGRNIDRYCPAGQTSLVAA